jgi:hypothetical protein
VRAGKARGARYTRSEEVRDRDGDRCPVAGLVGDLCGGVLGGIRGSERWSAARRAWMPWRGLRRSGDASAMRPTAGVSPTAVDPASTAMWSCLVIFSRFSAPLPPGDSRWWPTSVLGWRQMTR